MALATIEHETGSWPIVVSRIYGNEHTTAQLDRAYAAWTEFMQRGPHVLIMDMTAGNAGATAPQRQRVASWIKENEAMLSSGRQLAHVMVIDSAVVRGIVTAVFWLRPPANPHYVTRTLDEAVDRALECLRAAGIEVPQARIELARRSGSHGRVPRTADA